MEPEGETVLAGHGVGAVLSAGQYALAGHCVPAVPVFPPPQSRSQFISHFKSDI